MTIQDQFDQAMHDIYVNARKHCNYNPTYFLQMLGEKGSLLTAHQLIMRDTPSEGFTKLWECGRLDLAVEAVVLKEAFAPLFTEEVLQRARERLEEYGYEV